MHDICFGQEPIATILLVALLLRTSKDFSEKSYIEHNIIEKTRCLQAGNPIFYTGYCGTSSFRSRFFSNIKFSDKTTAS